jgi:hypothetical protein
MNEQMRIAGKCEGCGDSLDVEGDDAGVMMVWNEFRKLHEGHAAPSHNPKRENSETQNLRLRR